MKTDFRTLPFVDVIARANSEGGKQYVYYRRDGERVRLPSLDDPDFMDSYARIHSTWNRAAIPSIQPGTIADLIRHYQRSPEWDDLAPRSQMGYRAYLRILEDMVGPLPVRDVNREAAIAIRDKFRATPAKANHAVRVLSLLLSFALDSPSRYGLAYNPALRVKKLKTLGAGHRPWSTAEVQTFAENPGILPGLKLAFWLGLLTGQREADVLAMRWTDYADGRLSVKQSKTGIELSLPVLPSLGAILDGWQPRGDAMVLSATGRPFQADNFRHQFARAVCRAGLPKECVFHGLRKTMTGLLAAAECTNAEIKSVTGHLTDQMVSLYLAGAEQIARSDAAMKKLERLMNSRRA